MLNIDAKKEYNVAFRTAASIGARVAARGARAASKPRAKMATEDT